MVVGDLAVVLQRVPQRDRDTEEALATDEPIGVQTLDPALVTRLHERRDPLQLFAPAHELVAVLEGANEPLPAGDDLEWPVALLVELDRVRDGLRLADQVTALAQQLDDPGLRLLDRLAGDLLPRRAVADAGRGLALDAA